MKHYLKSRMSGTTQSYLTLKTLRTIPTILPDAKVLSSYNDAIGPIYQKVASNIRESNTISAIRDTLLPKLISGELPIKNAEKFLEQAGV